MMSLWSIRPARLSDMQRVWELRNLPEAVFWSGGSSVPFGTHQEWFPAHFQQMLVLEVDQVVRGYVRAAADGKVSLVVADTARGHGYGRALLQALADSVDASARPRLYATIHPSNIASIRTFFRAGYQLDRMEGMFQRVVKERP